MIHLYYGNGKGKTTASIGLAIRMFGAGKKVTFVQFLKDGGSSEVSVLKKAGISVLYTNMPQRFVKDMDDAEKNLVQESIMTLFHTAVETPCDCLILDELLDVIQLGFIKEEEILKAFKKMSDQEVVLTGRNPGDELLLASDYAMEIDCHKHPYQKGIPARIGVEF